MQTHSANNICIYIVFSSTPYKIGRMIRFFTRYPYNHVSISLDPGLHTMYSFARRYLNTPFYGGFVIETQRRFKNRGRVSQIKVISIRIDDSKLTAIKKHIKEMIECQERYIYNTLSALLVPLRRKINLPNAYTCVEYITKLLAESGAVEGIEQRRFYSISDLERLLPGDVVYEGPFGGAVSCGSSIAENSNFALSGDIDGKFINTSIDTDEDIENDAFIYYQRGMLFRALLYLYANGRLFYRLFRRMAGV
jgi:hypothetical protein